MTPLISPIQVSFEKKCRFFYLICSISRRILNSRSSKTVLVFRSLTLTIVVITMVVAVLVENVETILGLNGALMGTFIAFILPGLCFSKCLQKEAVVSYFSYVRVPN